jgi:alpha-tubulin suppressor-like RCC1 family protein
LGINSTADQGDGLGEMGDSLGVTSLGSPRYAVEVKAGSYFTCARLDDSSVKCWGQNNYGQTGQDKNASGNNASLGDQAGEMAAIAALPLGGNVLSIGAGNEFACALISGGTVKCWGRNNYGQLGVNNTTTYGNAAQTMSTVTAISLGATRTATAITVGSGQACAVLDNSTVTCWGYNGNNGAGIAEGAGRLGRGVGGNNNTGDAGGEMPAAALNIGTGLFALRAVTNNSTTCVQTTTGFVKCFGYNLFGTCGIGDNSSPNDNISDAAGEVGDPIQTTFLFDANY